MVKVNSVKVNSIEELAAVVDGGSTDTGTNDTVRARIASFRADDNASMMGGWT